VSVFPNRLPKKIAALGILSAADVAIQEHPFKDMLRASSLTLACFCQAGLRSHIGEVTWEIKGEGAAGFPRRGGEQVVGWFALRPAPVVQWLDGSPSGCAGPPVGVDPAISLAKSGHRLAAPIIWMQLQ